MNCGRQHTRSQAAFHPEQMDSARATAFDVRSPDDSSIDAKEAEDRKTSEDEIIKHWLSNQSLQDLERELAAAEQARRKRSRKKAKSIIEKHWNWLKKRQRWQPKPRVSRGGGCIVG